MPATDKNLQRVLEKHRGFWRRASTDKPILSVEKYRPFSRVQMRLADGSPIKEDIYLTPKLLDPKLMLELEESPDPPHSVPDSPGGISGDAFITRRPITRMPWVEAIMGCPAHVRAESGSIYSEPYLKSVGQLSRIPGLNDNGWLPLLKEYYRLLVENSRGKYHVVQSLMRGPVDLVAALVGYDVMCTALMDDPKGVRKMTEFCTERFLAVWQTVSTVIPSFEGGYVSAFDTWAPGTVVRSQCDASAAMSARMYEQFFMPYEEQIYSKYDYSVVHLHSGYLHTVPTYLKGKYPTAIQVSLDTGSTPETPHTLLPTFKKILDKKPLFITGPIKKAELDELLRELPAAGLCIGVSVMDA
jgi:hypothetical protein